MNRSSARRGAAAAVVGLAAVALTACAGGGAAGGGGGGGGDTIRIGMITADKGNLTFQTAHYALEAYVDKVNKAGGVNGRTIELITAEGGSDPQATAAAARELVDRDEVQALVANQSVVDCTVNAALYKSRGVAVFSPSYDPSCFTSDGIFPYAVSGTYQALPGVKFAMDGGARTIGFIGIDAVVNRVLADQIKLYVEKNGGTFTGADFVPPTGGGDLAGPVARLKNAKVDAIVAGIGPELFGPLLDVAGTQGIGPDKVRWVATTGAYGDRLAQTLGAKGNGIYATLTNEPLESKAGDTADVVTAMRQQHPDVPLDGFVSMGVAGGKVAVDVLKKVQGAPTRASILAAAGSTTDASTGTNPAVIDFSKRPVSIDIFGKMVQLENGAWAPVGDWIELGKPA